MLTVINEERPDNFVSVEGAVAIHRDNPSEFHARMFEHWLSPVAGWSDERRQRVAERREQIEELWAAPDRAIFEVTPRRLSGVVTDSVWD